jgi:hypothetical protein
MDVIGFGASGRLPEIDLRPGTRIDLAYEAQINLWNDRETVQLKLVSLRPSEKTGRAESLS